jgi:hypothetical protein
MMLAHGSVEVIYLMVVLLWLINVALLLPGLFARRAHPAVLIVTLTVTGFDGWFVWDTLRAVLDSDSRDMAFRMTLAASFSLFLLCGSIGVYRWMRLSKP